MNIVIIQTKIQQKFCRYMTKTYSDDHKTYMEQNQYIFAFYPNDVELMTKVNQKYNLNDCIKYNNKADSKLDLFKDLRIHQGQTM